jgi:cytochrome c oxidase subunit IV
MAGTMCWSMAMTYAIILPPLLVMVFVFLMTFEADYTFFTRSVFFSAAH